MISPAACPSWDTLYIYFLPIKCTTTFFFFPIKVWNKKWFFYHFLSTSSKLIRWFSKVLFHFNKCHLNYEFCCSFLCRVSKICFANNEPIDILFENAINVSLSVGNIIQHAMKNIFSKIYAWFSPPLLSLFLHFTFL